MAWPLALHAQQQAKAPTIGVIGTSSGAWYGQTDSFEKRLAELGWAPGRTISIDYRWTDGNEDKVRAAAEQLVAQHVDVIVAAGNAVLATKRATTTIPIVFPLAIDPVGAGFVDNLARPGGNVTGLSMQAADLAGKRVEFLRRAIPSLHRLGILANLANVGVVKELTECEAAARALGLEPVSLDIRQPDDIEKAFAAPPAVDALYVVVDGLLNANTARIAELALRARLPIMLGLPEQLAVGGLIGYGPNSAALFRRAAEYVDKILRGAKPSGLPVEQPSKFELVINLKTAKALGLSLAPDLLAQANEVIE
ncbi:MAG: ABC transporter substrate-binding protein [Alphaproteobacteria bacterium]|nr:ABC transporter substrate-binding protein [Alphaproteobacteria bacterium]